MGLTEMQQLAVSMRNRPVLVSAAAGSGKTSVLSKRVVSLLAGDYGAKPIDADRMLIVTFTRAASAELRERITKELEQRAAENPQDENLQRQRRLLPQAQISTIDALYKMILEQHFEKRGLPAAFSIIQGGALKAMQGEVLDALLEENYAAPDAGFAALRKLCENGSDQRIADMINATYATACAEPDIAMWIDCCKKRMQARLQEIYEEQAELTGSLAIMVQDLVKRAAALPKMRETVLDILEHPGRKPKDFEQKKPQRAMQAEEYGRWADALLQMMEQLAAAPQTLEGWIRALHQPLEKPTKKALPQLYNQERLAPWLSLWDEVQQMKAKLSGIIPVNKEHDKLVCAAVDKVYELVQTLHARLRARKLERGQLAFYDLGQETVALLADAKLDGDEIRFTQTDTARELAAAYDCVMVDECQDNNRVQDIIFQMLTDGTDHLFMVGDIKQSIYRFRHARPELFSARQQQYAAPETAKEGEPVCILLKDNFRSRESVIDTINFLFGRIMSPSCGEVVYDAGAAMRAGRQYEPLPKGFSSDTELHLIDNLRKEKDTPKLDQAEYTAKQIADMIQRGFPVTDAETGELRPCRYGDFMVLMRSRGMLARLADALEGYHISYQTQGLKGFYETSEIRACLSMMQAVVNPQDDLAFWGFLLSPFGLFDFDDAARLRLIANAHGCRYIVDALRLAAIEEGVLQHKAAAVCQLFDALRDQSLRLGIADFLQYAFARSSFPALLLAGEDGAQKNADLQLLVKDAGGWEQDHTGGIAGYLQYVDRLLAQEEDIEAASGLEQGEDVVQVMTIHASKGLEAPICILCGCEKTFNTADLKNGYLLDADLGLTLQYRDEVSSVQYYNEYGVRLKKKIAAAQCSEEMRLLYVAMTRAKEKLICIGSVDNLQSRLNSLYKEYAGKNSLENSNLTRLPEHFTSGVSNYLNWLMAGLLAAPESLVELARMGYPTCDQVKFSDVAQLLGEQTERPLACKLVIARAADMTLGSILPAESKQQDFTPQTASEEQVMRLQQPYRYKEVTTLPAKSSVTALSHHNVLPENMDLYQKQQEDALFSEQEDIFAQTEPSDIDVLQAAGLKKPAFLLEEEKRITGAMRGTATHSFLQYADFAAAKQDLDAELNRLVSMQFLTESDLQLINRYTITRFLKCDLCTRILTAQKEGHLLREYAFIHELPASEVAEDLPEDCAQETIVVQGIADCILVEEDGLVLIDYKTDWLDTPEAFVSRYARQLAIYAQALNQLFAHRYAPHPAVKQCVIYALHLGQEIRIVPQKDL